MGVVDVVQRLCALDLSVADRDTVEAVLTDSGRVRRWLDGVDVAAARRLAELADQTPSLFPDDTIARSTRTSRRQAAKIVERAATAATVTELGTALANGDISGEHLDVVTGALNALQPDQRDRLTERGQHLATVAAASTPEQFRSVVQAEVSRIEDDDGIARLQRQKRHVGLRWWNDHATGMIRIAGQFDAETGLALIGRLDNQTDTMFHTTTPDHCPTDPALKQEFLRAHALLALTEGDQTGSGRAEVIVVVDHDTLHHGRHPNSYVDVGIAGVHWPAETIRRWTCLADIIPVLIGEDGVVTKLGRSHRLADHNQRRILRVMYPTCAIPDCDVRFSRCTIHHLDPWKPGGHTDIDLLLPLCVRHHHNTHEGGWHLDLHPTTRQLTITLPDTTTITTTTTGPPTTRAG